MIIVTGTKRSGTSMWMQILKAAGFPVIGEPFPRNWGRSIREANRQGFYESSLRHGIHEATNPDPRTGEYHFPEETRSVAVKVFAPGLERTTRVFIDRVIATMRDVREYSASLRRLYALEREHMNARALSQGRDPSELPRIEQMSAEIEWWCDNFTLLRDAARRRYPLKLVSYAAVLQRPRDVVREVCSWLGDGDAALGSRAVNERLRTQDPSCSLDERLELPVAVLALCDELHRCVFTGAPLAKDFLSRMRDAHETLLPQIHEQRMRLLVSQKRVKLARQMMRSG